MAKVLCVFVIAGLLPVSSLSVSQQGNKSERARFPASQVSLTPAEQRAAALQSQFPDTELKKHTFRDYVHRYLFQHHRKPLKVTAFKDGRFKIKWIREFDSRDIDSLADAHPDLLQYVIELPESTESDAKVKFKIETEVTYEFKNEKEFEQLQPELFSVYRGFRVDAKE